MARPAAAARELAAIIAATLLCLLACSTPAASQYAPEIGPSALEPPASGGIEVVDRALARLATHRRLLVIGAHPDDEDTTLLALVALGGGEAAYLSLSRGEGGQNLIGTELGTDLGLLRTGELLAARRVDGARQFFTRAYDFGYSRSLEETRRHWPQRELLVDALRVVRRFRPQVIVSVFPPDERAGHGQHQAAGVTAEEVFRAAGEPGVDDAVDGEPSPAWRPAVLYREAWFDPESATLELPVGVLDPFRGRSIFQEAMASRGMHRSQDMGAILEPGPRQAKLTWVAGAAGPAGQDLFSGVDTRLSSIAASIEEATLRAEAERRLAAAERRARQARGELSPQDPSAVVAALAAIATDLSALAVELEHVTGPPASAPGTAAARDLVAEKVAIAEAGLAAAAGVVVDVVSDRETAAPGGAVSILLRLWNGGSSAIRLEHLRLEGFTAWTDSPARAVAPGELAEWTVELVVPAAVEPTMPYFLRRQVAGDLYDWSAAPPRVRGEPLGPPAIAGIFELTIAGAPVAIRREAVQRERDQVMGEVRRPLRVVPPVEVTLEPGQLVWPLGDPTPRRVEVTLRSHLDVPATGALEIAMPPGWPPPDRSPFALDPRGAGTLQVALAPPAGATAGRFELAARAAIDGGAASDLAVPVLDHPHVRPIPAPRPARSSISRFGLALPERAGRIGYLRGASDRVPEFLIQAGFDLELLDGRALAHRDLAAFRAIVVGSRAYETDPGLRRSNARLLDWLRAGGLLIVQYQQYAFVEGGFAPLPLTISRPHGRVTDETAPVRVLEPDHPALTTPNRLGPADWQGWVQERGLYFPDEWDPAYRPLLAMGDPGGPELSGALLVAPVGEGTYVYTGLALFRQIPAGVPGAYRLLANLLALARPR